MCSNGRQAKLANHRRPCTADREGAREDIIKTYVMGAAQLVAVHTIREVCGWKKGVVCVGWQVPVEI